MFIFPISDNAEHKKAIYVHTNGCVYVKQSFMAAAAVVKSQTAVRLAPAQYANRIFLVVTVVLNDFTYHNDNNNISATRVSL